MVYIESVRNWQSIYYYVRLDMVFNSLMKFVAYEKKDIVFNSESVLYSVPLCYMLSTRDTSELILN